MHKEGFYSSGEFAKKANVTVRTIRFYDKKNLLKPSYVNENGARFYTDADFARLQQILLFKYLGFSLDDIKNITVGDSDYNILMNSLHLQLNLIKDKIEQMQLVKNAIEDTENILKDSKSIDWSSMLSLIHLTNMENSLKTQYLNAGNISARINLHAKYSINKQGWFSWIYEQCGLEPGIKVLETGCGDGRLWVDNIKNVEKLKNIKITVTDISEGMVNDARRNIGNRMFDYGVADCMNLPFDDNSFDCVIANHVIFYCKEPGKAFREIKRVLKPGGKAVFSTYGSHHMQEIAQLVNQFDKRIVLSADVLYEKFGLDNGEEMLKKYFNKVDKRLYDDYLLVDRAEPIIEYILSCHGNQNHYLLDRYSDFKAFIMKKTKKPLKITKEAGVFVCFN